MADPVQPRSASDKTRHRVLWECDHMRLVVVDQNEEWRHLMENGALGGVCVAGVYQVQAIVGGQHTVGSSYAALGPA